MRFIELFAGIGGFGLGFERAGMTCVAQVELDAQARNVLAHHWPHVPRFDDVRSVGRRSLPACDVVCGGFPCQDLSTAGKRAGLAGARSGLFFEMVRVIHELRPAYVVWENVPGLLSANDGRDFAAVLMALGGIGYYGAWTVLDARFFGLAQRRRRVFGVFARGDSGARRAAEILSLAERLRWHPAQGSAAQQGIAGTLGSSTAGSGRRSTDLDGHGAYVVGALTNRQPTSDASCASQGHIVASPDPAYAVTGGGSRFGSGRQGQDTFVFEARFARNGRGAPSSLVPPLKAQSGQTGKGDAAPLVAFNHAAADSPTTSIVRAGEYAGALGTKSMEAVSGRMGVRRLTPLECERLQGFPDGWTDTPGNSDSARYRQLGNAVPVSVVRWIGQQLMRCAAADNDIQRKDHP